MEGGETIPENTRVILKAKHKRVHANKKLGKVNEGQDCLTSFCL